MSTLCYHCYDDRIEDTNATGGIDGDGSSDENNGNNGGDEDSGTSAVATGTPTALRRVLARQLLQT